MAAEALLDMVAGNLLTLVQEELATFWGVESQMKKLESYLTAITAVLEDAEQKQITSQAAEDRLAVQDWLQKLSDAAHVLDDILDECSIQSNLLKSRTLCFNPKKIWFRFGIGRRMNEMVRRLDDIDEERRKFEFRPPLIVGRQREEHLGRQTISLISEPRMCGRDQDRDRIVDLLLRNSGDNGELSVIPVVGMGGMGKTTLAKWIFNESRVSDYFELKIWVCVSNNFDEQKILENIVESVEIRNPGLSSLESLQKKVQQVLNGRRYLLVLDDVWSEDGQRWDQLKSVLLKCGSSSEGGSVLVTTRLHRVATIMGTHQPHQLNPLSDDDNWSVFKHHAFGSNKEEEGIAALEAIGREIVKKCGGSPLAAKALGSALQNEIDEKQWLIIKESKFWDIPQGQEVISALRISYFNLNSSLRRCFSFCAIYPEDSEINKDELIHLWMANGFIKSKGGISNKIEVEDVGNKVWHELCQRSFFHEVKNDFLGNTTFKIHDLFHELAQSISGKECKACRSEGLKNLPVNVHHIRCSDEELNVDKHAFKKLESLRTFVEDFLFDSSLGLKAFNNSIRALRTSSSKLSGLENLTHLRYLCISHNNITMLPKCVSRLPKLQILKLENCSNLTSLPKDLTQLKDLRHLLIIGCDLLAEMPSNIGEMTSLKTLSVFVMNSKSHLSLAQLRDLQLGGKLHIKGLENVHSESEAKRANLMKKELSELYLSWNSSFNSKSTNSEEILEALQPHSKLKSFGMKSYMGNKLPGWMMNTSILSFFVSVILYDCKNCDQLPPLGKLPHLLSLFVFGMENLKHIDGDSYDGVEEKAFKSLKMLTLLELPNLERMLRDEKVEMLPLLSIMKVCGVPRLRLSHILPSVELLDIEFSKLVSIDNDIVPFLEAIMLSVPHVKTLSLSNLSGEDVSMDGLRSLNSLKVLRIYDSDDLVSFKDNVLQGLSSLRTLTIYQCNKLRSLPESMGQLTGLEFLDIYDCPELVTLPSNINQLTALSNVLMFGSSTLPEGLQHIPSLKNLFLKGYKADSLPDWLGHMTSLQMLTIVACPNIRSLPSSFQKLTNLQVLDTYLSPELEKWCETITGDEWGKIRDVMETRNEVLARVTILLDYSLYWNRSECAVYSEFDALVHHIDRKLSQRIGKDSACTVSY